MKLNDVSEYNYADDVAMELSGAAIMLLMRLEKHCLKHDLDVEAELKKFEKEWVNFRRYYKEEYFDKQK